MSHAKAKGGTPRVSKSELVSHVVIPARLASTRLPKKLLLSETGKPVIQHTYEAALGADRPNGVTVAVDSQEMQRAVQSFGGTCVMTDPNLPSGTDRVAKVAEELADVDVFVNVQGDEPEINAETIDAVVELLAENVDAQIATLSVPIRDARRLNDPNCVKVVRGSSGKALYFSRSPIPFIRDAGEDILQANPPIFHQHLGIYAYRREFLLRLNTLPCSDLESTEKLEQLRFLDAGFEIAVDTVNHGPKGIDTADDYAAFVARQLGGRRAA